MPPNLYTPSWPLTHREYQNLVDRTNYLTTELDRVREMVMSASPGVDAATKERPQPGIITLPSCGGDGFIRVSEDGVIKSYVNPTPQGCIIPLFLSSAEASTTASSETTFREVALPANLIPRNGNHIVWQAGGFVLATGGNISNIHFWGRLQTASPDLFLDVNINQTINDGTAATWYTEGRLTRNDAGGTAEIGGFFAWTGATPFVTVLRGELSGFIDNWATPLFFRLRGSTTISAGTGTILSETFALYKHSMS